MKQTCDTHYLTATYPPKCRLCNKPRAELEDEKEKR